MGEPPVQRVVVLVAMEQEAAPFVREHALVRVASPPWPASLPLVAFRGAIDARKDMEVVLVWAGQDKRFKVNNVGMTAAAVSAYASVLAFEPDLVVSAGTGGGFGAGGARVGDVYLSTKLVFHSRRIPAGVDGGGDGRGGLQDYEEYGFGHYRCPPLPRLAAAAGLRLGVVSTSDSLDSSAVDLQIMRSEGVSVKEMEAGSSAWVCGQLGVPFVALKAVTDIVDGPRATADEFYSNLELAATALQQKLTHVLRLVAGRPLSNWHTEDQEVPSSRL